MACHPFETIVAFIFGGYMTDYFTGLNCPFFGRIHGRLDWESYGSESCQNGVSGIKSIFKAISISAAFRVPRSSRLRIDIYCRKCAECTSPWFSMVDSGSLRYAFVRLFFFSLTFTLYSVNILHRRKFIVFCQYHNGESSSPLAQ